ncbi:AraC family transcriptional regulator [bacterium]|jgi:AraC family transcriptional regulator|nr:AraC family transcriptional regulator [bacterium]
MDRKEYQDRIDRVFEYVRGNLDETILLDDIAKVACFSRYHIHRIFYAYTGETLGNYVRRLRLLRSAKNLDCSPGLSISRVALDSGYDTPASFARSFRKHFGCSPKEFRKDKSFIVNNTYYDRKKNVVIVPKEVKLKEMRLLCCRETGPYMESAKRAWDKIFSYAYPNKLITRHAKMFGIGYDDPIVTAPENIRYDACITVEKNFVNKGLFCIKNIPAGRYLACLHRGPYSKLNDTWNAMYKWVNDNVKMLADFASFERYVNDPNSTNEDDLITYIYLPLEIIK